MKTILLTGARAPATLDLARALNKTGTLDKNGYRVIAAESMAYPLSRYSNAFAEFYHITAPNTSSIKFIDDLATIIKKEKVTLLIPTCEEAFHVSLGKKELEEQFPDCKIFVDEPEILRTLHSKFDFNQLAQSFGFKVPKSILVKTVADASIAIEQITAQSLVKAKVILKPEFSRFASNTLILSPSEAKNILPSLSISSGVPWVVQECLEGKEFCTYSVAVAGKLLTSVTYDHEFTAGKGAGICFRTVEHAFIDTWVKKFVSDINYTGQIAFDFIGNQPLECNPRATSGIHLVTQNNLFIQALVELKAPFDFIRPKKNSMGQLRLAMLVYGVVGMTSLGKLKSWLYTFITAREVIFSWRDLKPFFWQFYTFLMLTLEAKKQGITALEVSTRDIEWNG